MSLLPTGGAPDLVEHFGRIDIYVFDQLLRGRLSPEMTVLDAGCGAGRNSIYLMRSGARVFGIDADEARVAEIREAAAAIAPGLSPDNFRVGRLEELPFADEAFDAVICSAVLHFAPDTLAFDAMLRELWRVTRSGGMLFTRLASTIGIERYVEARGDGRYALPDGTERFLVDERLLLRYTKELGGTLLDPIKTTNVQNARAMTTWVLRKNVASQ